MRADTEAAAEGTAAVEAALDALRLGWGSAYLIGYDDEHGWYASRHGQVGGLLEESGPDELRAALAADYGPARASQMWCTSCGKRVTAGAPAPVHAASGQRAAPPDGHLADPAGEEPPLWKDAREVQAEYRGAFRVTARLGILRADWSAAVIGHATAAHYTAPTGELLRRQLDEAVRGTRWQREAAP